MEEGEGELLLGLDDLCIPSAAAAAVRDAEDDDADLYAGLCPDGDVAARLQQEQLKELEDRVETQRRELQDLGARLGDALAQVEQLQAERLVLLTNMSGLFIAAQREIRWRGDELLAARRELFGLRGGGGGGGAKGAAFGGGGGGGGGGDSRARGGLGLGPGVQRAERRQWEGQEQRGGERRGDERRGGGDGGGKGGGGGGGGAGSGREPFRQDRSNWQEDERRGGGGGGSGVRGGSGGGGKHGLSGGAAGQDADARARAARDAVCRLACHNW
ncbi:MAG: hypothetical protein J3K34DRAFT_519985 [Monoraphidium minutum]|nr:MAG: hypothetical protein J3K34DRAFT_519985 [Monoraphidium minutum]